MRIVIVIQGQWGQRIASHVCDTAPSDWQIVIWRGPAVLPMVVDDPDEFLPEALPEADLLVVLTESAGLTDLTPDLAQLCGAQAVVVPVDRRSWAPPGLVGQVKRRLEAMGVSSATPMPFCSLAPNRGQHVLIREFARRYGRPALTLAIEGGCIDSCEIARETPCGNTRYVADRLVGVPAAKAVEQAGLLHHYYPCWGGMEVDPVQGSHTLLHIAAMMAQKSVERALADAGDGKEIGQE